MSNKDVFILGAGFSKGFEAPLQNELFPGILNFDSNKLSAKERRIYSSSLQRVINFLDNTMYIDHKKVDISYELEDVYTPLDKSIINHLPYRSISILDVLSIRRDFNVLISLYIKEKLKKIDTSELDSFSEFVCSYNSDPNKDKISFITTNWDIILDNSIYKSLNNQGVIDYCCHTTAFNKYENVMPALLARGLGKYNIKILKLHGSMNWLYCPRCGRLYITYYKKISFEQYISKPTCRICNRNYKSSSGKDGGPELESILLMPTYIKDLNNVQIKLIWQNASVELSEAKRIIFIGCSFPTADYEFRQLLSRTVPHETKIDVISYKDDKDPVDTAMESRYKTFFGKREVSFSYVGVKNFLSQYISEHNETN